MVSNLSTFSRIETIPVYFNQYDASTKLLYCALMALKCRNKNSNQNECCLSLGIVTGGLLYCQSFILFKGTNDCYVDAFVHVSGFEQGQ